MKLPVILGPTSTGKTNLALELCKEFNGEVISADSRQIYKYMDVGTGKIPASFSPQVLKTTDFWCFQENKVWGYDLVLPGEYFSAYDFAVFALDKAREVLAGKKVPFIVGGTGLYIDFFTGKIKGNSFSPNFEYRKELESKTLPELEEMVMSLNLEVNMSDFENKRRLVRIIERNVSPEETLSTPLPHFDNVDYLYVGLFSSREYLYTRADAWVESIWEKDAIITEVRNLISLGFEKTPQLNSFIYREAFQFIKNQILREDAIQKTKFDIHSYIRRQQTYFKKNSDITWFDISQDNWKQNIYNYLKDAEF